MSNQRPGKWKPATMQDAVGEGNPKVLAEFFQMAAEVLYRDGKEDAAFYFEQVEEWIRSGKSLRGKSAAHILGL